jgi:hypothetical protein
MSYDEGKEERCSRRKAIVEKLHDNANIEVLEERCREHNNRA